jgi:FkbM family methyltransferase
MRLAGLWIIEWLARGLPDDVMAPLPGGRSLRVDPRDLDGRLLLLFGSVDRKVIAVCCALLAPGDVFLDIGANYGSVGLASTRLIGPAGSVHLFEPQPDLCQRIQESLATQPDARVHLHRLALFDHDGVIELRIPERHSGAASVVMDGPGVRVTVPVRDAATMLTEIAGTRPLGAKVDIEGAEDRVINALVQYPTFRFAVLEVSHIREPGKFLRLAESAGGQMYTVGKALFWPRLHRVRKGSDMIGFEDVLVVAGGLLSPDRTVFSLNELADARAHHEVTLRASGKSRLAG